MGRPKFLLKDGGPGTIGTIWDEYSSIYDVCSVANPTKTPSQMGLVERSVGVIKFGLDRIPMASPELTIEEAVRMSCLSRNQCPIMSTGFSPSALAFGRSDLFDVVENGLAKPQSLMSIHEWEIQQHMLLLRQIRGEMISFDASRTLKMFV